MSAKPNSAKIGVLDSGVGGLSVLREIHRHLPNCSTLYVADQANLPYGPRDPSELDGFVEAISFYLIEQGAAVVVLACHSASAASLLALRQRWPEIAFVGMEPAVKPAVQATKSGVIAVLATAATANGPLYKRVLDQHAGNVRVITRVSPDLVALAESPMMDTPEGEGIIEACVEPLLAEGADQIVLACTHFPFLKTLLERTVGDRAALVDPSDPVARQVERVWNGDVCQPPAEHIYTTTGDPAAFQAAIERLLGLTTPVQGLRWLNGAITSVDASSLVR